MTTENTIYPNCTFLTYGMVEELDKQNASDGYGFNLSEILSMMSDHVKSWNEGEKGLLTREVINYRLTECNYHDLVSYLKDMMYKDALEWVAREF